MSNHATHRALAVALLLLASVASGEAAQPLRLLDHYADGGTLHFVVENTGATPFTPGNVVLRHRDTGFAPPLWWSRCFPPAVPPGGKGRLSLALRRAASLQGPYALEFESGVLELNLHTEEEPTPLAVAHLAVYHDAREAAIFLRNNGGVPLQATAIQIGGAAAKILPDRGTGEILPCDTGLVVARIDPAAIPSQDQPLLCAISTATGTFYRHAYAQRPPLFSLRVGEIPGAFICPTHRHGPWNKSAQEMFALQPGADGLLPEVHFCRNRLPEGLDALGQCLPRAVVNPQGSNLTRGGLEAWRGLRDVAGFAKRRIEPGSFSAMIESGSNFEGGYGQPARTEVEPMSPRDLRHTVYTAVAEGAKGIAFRFGDETPEAYRAFAGQLMAELSLLGTWLETADPVGLHAVASRDDIDVRTVYIGPRALLIIALRGEAKAIPPTCEAILSLDTPKWFVPAIAQTIGSDWTSESIPASTGAITLHVPQMDDLAVILIRTNE